MAGRQWNAEAARAVAPREAFGGLAALGKGLEKMPRATQTEAELQRTLIGARLLRTAIEDMEVFGGLKRDLEVYFHGLHEVVTGESELARIGLIKEINDAEGDSVEKKIKTFISDCNEKETKCQTLLVAAHAEIKQAKEDAEAAAESARVAAAKAERTAGIIEEMPDEGDTEEERQAKEEAEAEAREAAAAAKQALRDAEDAAANSVEAKKLLDQAITNVPSEWVEGRGGLDGATRDNLIDEWIKVVNEMQVQRGKFSQDGSEFRVELFTGDFQLTGALSTLSASSSKKVKGVYDMIVRRTKTYEKLEGKNADVMELSKASAKAFKALHAFLNKKPATTVTKAESAFHKMVSTELLAAEYRIHFAIVDGRDAVLGLTDEMRSALNWPSTTTTLPSPTKATTDALGAAKIAYNAEWDS